MPKERRSGGGSMLFFVMRLRASYRAFWIFVSLVGRGLVFLVFVAFFSCFWGGELRAQSAPPEVRAVVAKMASLKAFRANIRFGSAGKMTGGVLSYQNGRSHLRLSDGRVVAGNGRSLVVYSPSTSTAGKQSMVPGGSGLAWILSGFDYTVRGTQAYGKATDPNASTQEVRILWGKNHILRRLSIKRKDSKAWFDIAISNVRTVGGFPASLFSYKPPSGSRTVENPLDQRN